MRRPTVRRGRKQEPLSCTPLPGVYTAVQCYLVSGILYSESKNSEGDVSVSLSLRQLRQDPRRSRAKHHSSLSTVHCALRTQPSVRITPSDRSRHSDRTEWALCSIRVPLRSDGVLLCSDRVIIPLRQSARFARRSEE